MPASDAGAGPYRWGDRLEQVVHRHAGERPGAVAVRQGDRTLTYQELVDASRRVSAGLRKLGVTRGSVVAVDLGRCPELVVAIMGVLGADAAYTVIDPDWPSARREQAIRDADCVTIIDNPSIARLQASEAYEVDVTGDGSDVAAIFYTSGSTGRPKGIRSPHRGPIRTLVGHADLPFDISTVVLQAAALPWDGLSLELWAALLNGGELRMLPLTSPTVDSVVLASMVADGLNTVWLTSSLFNVLAETAGDTLSRLRLLMVGGERVSAQHIGEVLNRGGPVRIVNGYGPAEATIFTTTRVLTAADGPEVPIGRAVPCTGLLVVDPSTGTAGSDRGELWIAGDGLAHGYVDPRDDVGRFTVIDGVRYYRSGDLVRVADGELWFEGRVDDQVKIAGVRIDPAHVENVLSVVPGMGSCHVTVTQDEPEHRRLVCVYTSLSGEPINTDELHAVAAGQLIRTMVPEYWIHLDTLPLTGHGKVDRDAVRRCVAEVTKTIRTPGTIDGDDLDLLRAVTGLPGLTADDDIVAQVHSSLQLVRLAGHLSGRWNHAVPVADVYRHRTLSALRELRPAADTTSRPRVVVSDTNRPTRAELRFWLAEQLDPGACDNMLVLAYVLDSPGSEDDLVESLRRVLFENPALRTTYVDDGDLPHVVLVDPTSVPVSRVSVDETDPAKAAREYTDPWWERPFALDHEAPFRAGVLTLADGRIVLCIHVHHIAFDGWSEMLMLDRIADLLRGAPTDPGVGSVDRLSRDPAATRDALGYWRDVVNTAPSPVLPVPTGLGEQERRERSAILDAAEIRAIGVAIARGGVHPATACVSSVAGAVAERLGRDEVSVGTVVPERLDAHDQNQIGYFVNPVVVALAGLRKSTSAELASIVASNLAAAERHGFIPFEDVAAMAGREHARHPIFQVWAVLQHARNSRAISASASIRPIRLAPPRTHTELMIEILPGDDTWEVVTFWRADGISDSDGEAIHEMVVERLLRSPSDLDATENFGNRRA